MGLLRGPADRQRRPRHPPRPEPRLQGHLPPLSDDDRSLRRAQGWLGLPRARGRACGRGRARDDLQGGHRALRDRRVQRPLPREGAQPCRGVEPADRADRLLDRPRRRLPDARLRLHRVSLVGAEDDRREGAAVREAQGRALLPAVRDGALEPRARTARRLSGRGRPVGLSSASRSPRHTGPPPRRRAAGLDDDTVDARLQRGRRRRPRPDLRPRADADGPVQIVAAGAGATGARRGRRDPRGVPRLTSWSAPDTSRRSTTSQPTPTAPRATRCCRPTSSPPRTAPASSTPRSRSASRTSGSASSRG